MSQLEHEQLQYYFATLQHGLAAVDTLEDQETPLSPMSSSIAST